MMEEWLIYLIGTLIVVDMIIFVAWAVPHFAGAMTGAPDLVSSGKDSDYENEDENEVKNRSDSVVLLHAQCGLRYAGVSRK